MLLTKATHVKHLQKLIPLTDGNDQKNLRKGNVGAEISVWIQEQDLIMTDTVQQDTAH